MSLPPELFLHIVRQSIPPACVDMSIGQADAYCDRYRALCRYSLVCRTWYELVQPLLYEVIHLDILQRHYFYTPGSLPWLRWLPGMARGAGGSAWTERQWAAIKIVYLPEVHAGVGLRPLLRATYTPWVRNMTTLRKPARAPQPAHPRRTEHCGLTRPQTLDGKIWA